MITSTDIAILDRDDPLAALRDRFVLPEGVIYLDGNSLGPAPRATREEITAVVEEEWAQDLIASWNKAGWFALPQSLGDRLAPLVGALPGELLVCDGVSANLFKCLHAALALRPDRHVLVAEEAGFPTDLYIASGVGQSHGDLTTRLEGRGGADLESLIDGDVAVVLVNHVDYKTGALRDMHALTRLAHGKGALVIWDLCHSAGVMPIDLAGCGADFAVGCTYKYLNGGLGAPGFLYVASSHHEGLTQPLTGWWSHADPFAFSPDYQAAPGIKAMLTGTQPILSMRALSAALDVYEDVELDVVRAKSTALTDLFVSLIRERCDGHGLTLVGPADARDRGSHVSLSHPDGFPIMQALIAQGAVGDFRAPDILRFGFAPLYIRFCDVEAAVEKLKEIMDQGTWRDPAFTRRSVVT